MLKRRLGNTDMEITLLGFGSWAIGGGNWAYGWGAQNDQDAVEAIVRAVDLGMNWIDTAAVYGLGHAEELVGRAVASMQEKPFIFTKCALVWDETRSVSSSLKAGSVRRECEASLQRLQVNAIDLYQMHWPDPDEDIEEGWLEMAKLQSEGLVRHIGVSNFTVAQMQRALAIAPIASLQPPYSMLRRAIEKEILPFCFDNNIGVIVYSPMLSGMLSGAMTKDRAASFAKDDWRRNNREFQEPRLSRNLELVELLRQVGALYGRSAGEVAIAWALRHPVVTGVIVGGRNALQVEGVIGAGEFLLSDEDASRIESFIATMYA
ncbi:aldo/keto reductase [Chlorobium phaeobacteroides]|jgi:aryl-alcohol dehydrogenase-like predicted oxidoreductase|uniref:Aldo/keto reductase n=1 Tax=Chlorobium phaeobacteroides (strain DSM 266 / SMG 266 / 2430) TaxID=290317 RepID=A1BHQ9_CHLPD|nr:aldo/keto reductase [Chlorobium phaeobacteroides]ABL65936.1 aldo/keto reductase [Chlorobium phaeobacteroides DSM 266]MBV5327713.1 aldo/keto reductase [Chlorobium sp.]